MLIPSPDTVSAPKLQAVLVVDDEPIVADLLAAVLRHDGYEVDTAANGAVALERVKEHIYDLILCDIRMPELDGPGFYREVARHHPELCHRFIFVTGASPEFETVAFLRDLGRPFLSKPFRLAEARALIQWVLRS